LLNWNGDQHIHTCIQHILDQTYRFIEIIIVDNKSTDGSIQKITKMYPGFKYILNNSNLGFAKGMNQGINISNGEYIIPMNQDVCLDKKFVENCINKILKNDGIGAVGGRVYSWLGDELTCIIRQGEGEGYFLRKRFQGISGLKTESERLVFAPTGSFPFLKRSMLDDIFNVSGDFYDENYVTGWEDIDLFFRMHLRGWKCIFLPDAYGWHVGSGSVGGKSTLLEKDFDYQIRILRNRYFTIIKNLPINIILWLSPYLLIAELALIPYFLIKSPKTVLALIIAWKEIISNIGILKLKRKLILNSTIVPKNYLKQFFIKF
jgi:GT2 family glycosyltransferase